MYNIYVKYMYDEVSRRYEKCLLCHVFLKRYFFVFLFIIKPFSYYLVKILMKIYFIEKFSFSFLFFPLTYEYVFFWNYICFSFIFLIYIVTLFTSSLKRLAEMLGKKINLAITNVHIIKWNVEHKVFNWKELIKNLQTSYRL